MAQSRDQNRRRWLTPLTIAAAYIAVGLPYIALSDRALDRLANDPDIRLWVSIGKGAAYVLLSGLLLWLVMRRMVGLQASEQSARQMSDRRLRAILETEPECVKVVAGDGTLVDINPAGLRMIEADAAEQVVGKNILPILVPENREAMAAMLGRVAAGLEREDLEFDIVGFKGSRRRLQSTNVPLRGPDGVIEGVLAVTRDISERRRTEEAARAGEKMLSMVTDAIPVFLSYIDSDERYRWVNQRYEAWYGLPREQIVGRTVAELQSPEAYRVISGHLRRALGGERVQYSNDLVSPVDERLSFETLYEPHVAPDGAVLGCFVIVVDVTARKRSEDALRRVEERFREMAEATSDIFVLFDWAERRVVYASPALERVLGLSASELMRDSAAGRRLIHPEDRAWVIPVLDRARETAEYDMEYRIVRDDGSVRWLHSRMLPIRGADGAVLRAVGITRDVTDRKTAEAALRESEARYRAVVEDQTELVCRFRPDGTITLANHAYARYFGKDDREIIGVNMYDLVLDAAERERLRARLGSISAESPVVSLVAKWRMADGHVRARHWVDRGIFNDRSELVEIQAVGRDITEQTRAEEALRQSEATTRALLDAVPDLMFRMDREGRYLAFHAPDHRDLMRPPSEFLGKTAAEVVPPDRAAQCMAALGEVFRTGQPQVYEYMGEPGEGRDARHWEVRVVRCGENEALLLVRDVSQRKRAEAELWHSQERMRLLVNQTPLGVIVWDMRFEVSEWNPGAESIFGYPASEAVGRPAEFIVPATARAHVRDLWRSLLDHRGGTRSTNDNRTRDGRTIRCEWYNTTIVDADGRAVGVASIVQDVTERERAAEALRASEARYRLLFESNLDALLLWDDSGTVTGANAAASDLLGRPVEAITGRPYAEVIRTPISADRLRRAVGAFGPDGVAAGELEILRPEGGGGGKRTVEFAARRVMGAQTMIILQDVSERKEAERRQAMMMAELDHRVKNNLSAVLALAEQSVRTSSSMEAFIPAFIGRIRAMSRMHSALAQGRWEGAPLRQLIRQSLEAYMMRPESADQDQSERISLHGADVVIPARAVSPLTMALHELATNAAKYGSLGPAGGQVSVEWRVEEVAGEGRRLVLRWIESGGPAISSPARRGFGTELIRGGIAYELQGSVTLEFPPEGARCQILMPLDEQSAVPINGVPALAAAARTDRDG